MSKITIKNVSTATIRLYDPETRFNRDFAPGRVIPITREQYENFTYDSGFMNILRAGFIKISGLEEDDIVEEVKESKGKELIIKMLQEKDITNFSKFLPKATIADKESVVEIARQLKVTDNAFTALIKKYCGVDIIKAIDIEHQANEK